MNFLLSPNIPYKYSSQNASNEFFLEKALDDVEDKGTDNSSIPDDIDKIRSQDDKISSKYKSIDSTLKKYLDNQELPSDEEVLDAVGQIHDEEEQSIKQHGIFDIHDQGFERSMRISINEAMRIYKKNIAPTLIQIKEQVEGPKATRDRKLLDYITIQRAKGVSDEQVNRFVLEQTGLSLMAFKEQCTERMRSAQSKLSGIIPEMAKFNACMQHSIRFKKVENDVLKQLMPSSIL